MLRHTVRLGRLVLGVCLLAVGGVLALPGVPGPGLLVMFGGLTLLATEFHWARRTQERLRAAVARATGRSHGREGSGGGGPLLQEARRGAAGEAQGIAAGGGRRRGAGAGA